MNGRKSPSRKSQQQQSSSSTSPLSQSITQRLAQNITSVGGFFSSSNNNNNNNNNTSGSSKQQQSQAASHTQSTGPLSPPRRPRLSSREYHHHHHPSHTHSTSNDTIDGPDSVTSPSHPTASSSSCGTAAGPATTTTNRVRLNSRDIARSYSGLYGDAHDWLPFEMNRHATPSDNQFWSIVFFVSAYATVLVMLHSLIVVLLVLMVGGEPTPPDTTTTTTSASSSSTTTSLDWKSLSWTFTNAFHLIITILYIHWLKGNLYDEQGEMSGLTVWEQLEATKYTQKIKSVLYFVPTLLCYISCHVIDYDLRLSCLNVSFWLIAMLAKSPFMNGVRIFGINRTVGIDDDDNDGLEDDTRNGSNKDKQQ